MKTSETLLVDLQTAGKQVVVDEELNLINDGARCGFWFKSTCESRSRGVDDTHCLVDYCCVAVTCHADDTNENDASRNHIPH